MIERNENAPEPSDAELLRDIAGGCEHAFVLLFRRWSPMLGRFLARATGSPDTADDLLQEAFLRVLRSAGGFEPRGSVEAWLYRICSNLAYSFWRRRDSRAPLAGAGEEDELRAPHAWGPESCRERSAFLGEVGLALDRIPPNQRLVFLLKADQGLTYEEIARVLDCPVGTAKSRFHWAVRRLREELKDWDDAPEGDLDVV